MSYIQDHHRRWGALFGHEPWFDMQCALYEGPGHDWEGADLAMKQVLYALAKARGLNTTQRCPWCKRVVDQVRSLPAKQEAYGKEDGCEGCKAQANWEYLADALVREERRIANLWWYRSLSPEQREVYRRQRSELIRIAMHGLINRDVQ